ncbi:hypothetical protein V494_03024 [Pseudogymnoascus sp. VKM F-4513 (FW-928)]|nr:hypothetical protein V494_03024 [Pseudogymnoascus sp. VKM F-4513 (FW-928)]
MPSFHSDELNNRTLDDPFFQTLNDTRQSQENAALKNWPLQQPTVRTNYETTPPRTPTDSLNSMNDEITPPDNGGMFTDNGLGVVPNGRPARNSWEDRLVRNTSALSINGGMAGIPENGTKNLEPVSRSSKSLSTERNSFSLANGAPLQQLSTAPDAINGSQTANGHNESYKRMSPPPSSYNPQSTGPLSYTSSLVGSMKHLDAPPTTQNGQNPSQNRLSPDYLPRTPTAGPPALATGSSPNPGGPSQLKQRVPKSGPPRASTDESTLSTGRFSPIAANMRRGSLSINRRNTQSIHSNIPHEDIAQDEDALRWAEAIRQKRASKRKRRDEEDEDRVVVGTKVDQNHVNWVTAYNMLTGIRFTVSRTNAKMDRELTDSDFAARHKFSFDITGNELTPSAKYDFKFKDYAPWVFRRLRAHFKLDPADYLMSLTSKYILSELGSPGKSGSFFYFSRDYKYIIKTIHHAEHKLLRKILKDYYHHVEQNPNTLLSQFYGLHRVKVPYGGKIHFVVMNNLFPPHRDIHQTFDLKGSTIGRDYKEDNVVNNPRATLKDLNWLRRNYHLEFGPEKKNTFLEQMEHDVRLLQKLKIMDYSMLVGIHDLGKGNQENLRDKTLRVFQPGGDTSPDDVVPTNSILTRTPSKLETARKAHELRKIIKQEKPIPMGESTTRMPEQMEENTSKRDFTFYSDDGGFRATHEDNSPGEEIYYLGIIDLLTHYGTVKRLENFWKGLSHDKQQISPIPPLPYGERFIKFIMDITKSREEVRDEVREDTREETREDLREQIREENEEALPPSKRIASALSPPATTTSMADSDEYMSAFSSEDDILQDESDNESGDDFGFDEPEPDLEISQKESPQEKRRPFEVTYKVYHPDDIQKQQDELIDEVNMILDLKKEDAAILLRHFRWNKERLIEDYMDRSKKVLEEAGLGPSTEGPPTLQVIPGFMCDICCEDEAGLLTFAMKCGHRYCVDCYRHYLSQKIKEEGEAAHIQCPQDGCKRIMDSKSMDLLVAADLNNRYHELLTRTYVEDKNALKWCPAPDCVNAVECKINKRDLDKVVPTVACDCGYRFCFGCILTDHQPAPCDLVKRWLKKCADDSETANWISANTKECPKCNSTIEKNGGCNHMTCRKCKHEFCWMCMGLWSEHGTSWYNCNRFEEGSGSDARDAMAKSRVSLERYLHYYNRYANHEQSAKLDKDIATKTEKKMVQLQSASGLSWIEVQYLNLASQALQTCRQTLKWTYAFAFYLARNNLTEMFEDNQKDLEMAVENLSEMFEKPVGELANANLRVDIMDKTSYCNKRRVILLADTAENLANGVWSFNGDYNGTD